MGAHLAAVYRVFDAHALLNEGMPSLTLYRMTAIFLRNLDGIPSQARIVNDLRAGLFLKETLGEKPNNIITLDEGRALIEEEAAIEIPIPGDADIGPVGEDCIDARLTVLDQ